MDAKPEAIRISYGIQSLEFDGSVVTLKAPRGTIVIPVHFQRLGTELPERAHGNDHRHD